MYTYIALCNTFFARIKCYSSSSSQQANHAHKINHDTSHCIRRNNITMSVTLNLHVILEPTANSGETYAPKSSRSVKPLLSKQNIFHLSFSLLRMSMIHTHNSAQLKISELMIALGRLRSQRWSIFDSCAPFEYVYMYVRKYKSCV